MPASVTVWAVDLVPGSPLEGVKGSLALAGEALVFRPGEPGGAERRFALIGVERVRRHRGSPVLSIVCETSRGRERVAFYFVQPPPLDRPDETTRPGLAGLAGLGRPTKRRVRRQNVSYLGLANRHKREVLREWEHRVRAAVRTARGND